MAELDLNTINSSFPTTFSGVDINVVAYLSNTYRRAIRGLPILDNKQTDLEVQDEPPEIIDEDSSSNPGGVTDDHFFELGTISTISYSTFREKLAVRNLGQSAARSYTRGQRTIAGTMIFTVFNHFELDRMITTVNELYKDNIDKINLLDQLPPFHVILVFSNEFGHTSAMHFFDLEFATEGQSQSIQDVSIDRQLTFYAKDILPLRPQSASFISYRDMYGLPEVIEKRRYLSLISRDDQGLRTFDQLVQSLQNEEILNLLARNRRTTA